MARDILDRLDAAIDGLCPCGAEPREGSAYCGYDCEPTHRAVHTISDTDGTQMRWRPDLVTAFDDSDLHDLGTMTWYTGAANASLYQRGIPHRGQTTTWHLRLDDGHRYVGLDLAFDDTVDVLADDHVRRMTDAWTRLERELGNQRHTEPAHRNISAWDIWHRQRQEDRAARYARDEQRICDWLRANHLDPNVIPAASAIRIHDGQITVNVWVRGDEGELQIHDGEPVTRPHTVPLAQPWPDGLDYDGLDIQPARFNSTLAAWFIADRFAARVVNARDFFRITST
ncbi:hypothetical protein FHR83_006688 [Actinoplanes campanulatus]|uniref:Uncharacterized protein n=1 Tax=Actinoplanes campanulatus TaxID=113559 RepID=A0A7W5FHZ7_9ACTN|nr:hypothetical protein [Actinoplanes campanulatus]MBB3098982.1 hypothetical protein [Actinoplanes campanulatus]GGN39578.1 hypothetical protein GCM10010109_67680 [Actinoplanes campanulatus]